MAYDVIKITGGGVGDLTLTAAPYAIAAPGYAPAASRLRDNPVGGHMYDRVVDTIPIVITASTKLLAKDALADLAAAIDQAARWGRGEDVAPVLLAWQADGSGSPVEAVIYGSAGRGWLSMPPTYRADLEAFVVGPLAVQITRSAWLGPATAPTSTSSAAVSATINSATWAVSADHYSPVKMEINQANSTRDRINTARLVLATTSVSDHIKFVEGEAFTLSGPWAEVADTNARGGKHLRYTPTVTTEVTTDETLGTPWPYKYFHVYALMQVGSGSATYKVRLLFRREKGSYEGTPTGVYTKTLTVAGVAPFHELGYFGTVAIESDLEQITLAVTASATGGTLEIDFIMLVRADDPGTNIIHMPGDLSGSAGAGTIAEPLTVDHQILSKVTPAVTRKAGTGPDALPVNYLGNPYVHMTGTVLYWAVIGYPTGGQFLIPDEVLTNGTFSLTATRRLSYLVPE